MIGVLETQRLWLKHLTVEDVGGALEMFTDPAVMTYVGDVMSEDAIRAEMAVWIKRGGDGCIGIWSVLDRATGECYGSVFLLPIPIDVDDTDWDDVVPGVMPDGDVEIGFILKRSAWGRGYATEVCSRLLRFAFEETPLTEVVATLYDENVASQRVLEKCGLTYRGRRRAYADDDCPDWRISRDEPLA